jgi:hypothetical protein
MEIKNEDDFLFMIYKKIKPSVVEAYPKVTEIPTRKRITPDIDLLVVDRLGQEYIIQGYELKLLKYSKKEKIVPLTPFYTGLGEVCLLFQHGIDQAYLVIGLYNIPKELLQKVEDKIMEIWSFITKNFYSLTQYLGIKIFREDRDFAHPSINPSSNFPTTSYEDTRHKRECIIRGELSWGKKWLSIRESRTKM